jgi:chromate transporter
VTAGPPTAVPSRVSLATIAREWGRIGCIGFGGPPAHIALLRKLCVSGRGWLPARQFEDGIAATGLLPGPASTQLAIYCAWCLRGTAGALIGGFCFIVPGLIVILALSGVFLSDHPPTWITGAAAGAGAAVPIVAVAAAVGLLPASWARVRDRTARRVRWIVYVGAGFASAALIGPWLALVIFGCGTTEAVTGSRLRPDRGRVGLMLPLLAAPTVSVGGLGAVAWVATKVGLLAYGGGFVIVPLMQRDAVHTYHWMTGAQFLTAVALGQLTPGPVVQTVVVVGYAAAGVGGGILASFVAFLPSFVFVLAGGPHFDRLRSNQVAQTFLTGAGAAAIGAIAGSAIPLGLELEHLWQVTVLVAAAVWLLVLRKGVVVALVGGALAGVLAAALSAPIG